MSKEYVGSWVPPPIDINKYRMNNIISDHHDDDEYDACFGLMEPISEESDGDVSDLFTYDVDQYASDYDTSDLFSFDLDRNVDGVVCVVVWKLGSVKLSSASMDALVWTLDNDLHESSVVYLVHVFPQIRFIPTLLGRLPISQANAVQKEGYRIQERSKRRESLQTFVSVCASSKVEVEIVLIESDREAKAILDLIPKLNIRKLVLGATQLTVSKLKSSDKKGGGGTLDQILHNAPEFCEVKVICEGKEVLLQDQLPTTPVSPSISNLDTKTIKVKPKKKKQDRKNGFLCSCFMF